jgi:CelD/BcsL family acetyltransferase involved in cellulose biosynthesis
MSSTMANQLGRLEDLPGGARTPPAAVETIDPASDPRWLSFLADTRAASIFHHPEWLGLLRSQYGYRMSADVAVDGAGEILAGLPFAHIRSRLTGSRRVCVPFSDVCGPAARNGAEPAIGRVLETVRARHERDGIDAEIRAPLPGVGSAGSEFCRHTLPLDPDVDVVRRTIRASVRRHVARAEREGITVSRATGRPALDAFFRLHLRTHQRLGVPTQPKGFIRRFNRLFAQDLGFVLLAECAGQTIAAAVFLTFNGVVTYKYSASSRAHLEKRPNNALLMEAIRWGCEHGYHTFDMGRTDLDNEGLRSFKRGWGAQEDVLTYTVLARRQEQRGPSGVPGALSAIITRTPPITGRLVGAALYKHFG